MKDIERKAGAMKKVNISIIVFALGLFLFAPSVHAALNDIKPPAAPNVGTDRAQAAQENRALKLTEAKLKVCQKKQSAIQKRSSQLTKMVENMLTKFSRIEEQVKKYYNDKAVPAGKTVANYDALVAEITTKKAAVRTDLDKASASSAAFSCTSDDPKSQLSQFRADMQTVKKSLQEYRTAIKNLIVAIRTASSKIESPATP